MADFGLPTLQKEHPVFGRPGRLGSGGRLVGPCATHPGPGAG